MELTTGWTAVYTTKECLYKLVNFTSGNMLEIHIAYTLYAGIINAPFIVAEWCSGSVLGP